MKWLFPKKEYHTRRGVFGESLWHSHAIENAVTDTARATPIGVVVDLVQGNETVYEEVFGSPGGTTPTDDRPTCTSFERANLNADSLLNFNTTPDCKPPNNLPSWLTTQRIQFCQNVNNFTLNPGGAGGSCSEINAGQALAKSYCSQGANIKASWCEREDLGDNIYAELASVYCRTDTGKADQWCTCYNVKEGVCDTDPNAAGCADKALNFDSLVANTPNFFKPQWIGREGCFGACRESGGESKYLPIDETNVCASDINICGGTINADNMTKSAINSTCTIGANTFDPVTGQLQDPAGNPVDNPNKDKDSTNFFTKYFPTSLADLTGDDTNKKIGAGASVSFLLLCCICLIIVIVMLSPGGGSSRFRR